MEGQPDEYVWGREGKKMKVCWVGRGGEGGPSASGTERVGLFDSVDHGVEAGN